MPHAAAIEAQVSPLAASTKYVQSDMVPEGIGPSCRRIR